MNDAAGGRHPLDVARTDHTAVAGGVTMLDLAGIDDGDGLETAMRMLADAAPLLRWFEIVRPGIVEQQEWAYVRAQRVVREERPDREAVAHPMLPVDRKSVVLGKSVYVRVDLGVRRSIKKNIHKLLKITFFCL